MSGFTAQPHEPTNPTLDADYLRRVHVMLDGCCAACGPCFFPTTTAASYGPCEGFPCPTLKALDGAA